MLQSPSFVYRVELGEPDPTRPGWSRLRSHELASRLSFVLWGRIPDDALLDAAERGTLETHEGLRHEARRLLDDDRARETVRAFFREYLGLSALDALDRDPTLFPSFTPALGAMLPDLPEYPAVRYIVAFALIIIGALLAGALVAWPLSSAVRAAGLGFVDRFLGSIFGLARGVALVLAFVIVAGLTPLPRTDWWHRAVLVPPLVAGVIALAPHLPAGLRARLDYSQGAIAPKAAPAKAA